MRISTILALAWLGLSAAGFGVVALVRLRRRAKLRKRYGAAALPRVGLAWRSLAPAALLVAGAACLILALGQLRLDRRPTQGTVVLAIDSSDSMKATDVAPTRLRAAERAAGSFLTALPDGFRVGVVAFAGDAHVVAPTSEDGKQAAEALDTLVPTRGTAIGDGLSVALDLIEADWRASGKRPAAIVLLSDGADTASAVTLEQAAMRATTLGIPIFTVSIVGETGEGAGANAPLLERIAAQTGGGASTAATAGELGEVYGSLSSQLSSDLAVGGSAVPMLALGGLFTAVAVVFLLGFGVRAV